MTAAPRIVETHSALIFCVGDRAYKVKKPVDLGFLDFSTREARQAVCHREVALNRRLAPDVYLGVYDVTDPSGSAVDHVVVMRRMPEDRSLAALVQAGEDVTEGLRSLARLIAGFHATAAQSPAVDRAGSLDSVRRNWQVGLEQLRSLAGGALPAETVDRLGALAGRYLDGRGRLLEMRRAQGFLRDGHGDLLCADVYLLPDGPRVLDCIEFDDALRHGDVLLDVAFLAMDLEDLGRRDLAELFLASYDDFSGHPHPPSLTRHFIAYRAQVRSKVGFLRWTQGDEQTRTHAVALAELALRHLEGAAVRLLLVGGLPGTGKSTVAASLADSRGWTLLRSDVLRKQRAGLAPQTPAPAAYGEGLYSPRAVDATYDELLRRARTALELGESVVLDASWSSERWREAARAVAESTSSDLVELVCTAPPDVAEVRLRSRDADASDADEGVARQMAVRFDPWPTALELDTDRPLADTLRRARAEVDAVPRARTG